MRKYYFCLPLILAFMLFACRNKESEVKESEVVEAVQEADTARVQSEPDSLVEVEKEVHPEPFIIAKTDEGQYTVQLSSWRKRKNAEREAQRFIKLGYDAYIQEAYLADRNETWYRVRIGRFNSKKEVRQIASQLAEVIESEYGLDKKRAEK
ncbi:MAG: SPOR domain-containing protein [bacterium]